MRVPAAAVALALLAACATGPKVWMRSGGTASEASLDELKCTEQSEGGGQSRLRTEVGGFGVSLGVAGGVGPGGPVDRSSMRSACLRNKGYRLIAVSPEEDRQLRASIGAEKEVVWRQVQARGGMSAAPGAGQ